MATMKDESYEVPNTVIESVPAPKVTIRTLAYNHAQYIEECIEGVLMQETSFPFEYIIAEDNSTDGTKEIVFEYAKKYHNVIRVVTSDENVGGRQNLYRADLLARGEYIASCEGDDYWTDPKKLEKQITLMEKYPDCHLSFHPVLVEWVGTDLKKEIYKRHADHNRVFPVERIITEGGEFCPTVSIVFKRESRKILGDWLPELPVGDYFTQITASLNGGALYIDEVMAVYRKGVSGSWSKKHNEYLKMCEHSLRMIKAIRRFDRQSGYRFQPAFKRREVHVLKRYSVFKAFDFETQTVQKVISLINKHTSGSLKLKCYYYLFVSFLYYRMKFGKLFEVKNWVKARLS